MELLEQSLVQVNQDIYDALTALQHRGQDAAGIMTCDQDQVFLRKGNGLVRDVIKPIICCYCAENGDWSCPISNRWHRQPLGSSTFICEFSLWFPIVHNGNLINSEELKQDLFQRI